MNDKRDVAPDSTAARVALWRALHVEADPPPHVLEDKIGLQLLAPDEGWRARGDMDPQFTRPFRASIVARARFIEDLVVEQAGFDDGKPAVVVSTGVSMYLTTDANAAALREVAAFAPGSTFAMTFLLPLEMADPGVRPGLEMAEKGARASGTPFLSFFTPQEMLALAHEAGFKEARHVSAADLTRRYFTGRTDGLRPPNNAEELLVAKT
ncbi:hypothetical protein LMG28614_03704 [Paraburkholderia ultramafica]|uniref:Uncharacterized protein n=1 Tax=Paraburkholderia ultramafica TaxID=1544867 RepID=A0A6S7BB42_9BURK|nr:class I SAM-dependent methyltransferase [Paraburkholderia ultramafica]CAB3793366.1 hypothetical protein LMG28614_03704 [Paraburkholderia ultramafica]